MARAKLEHPRRHVCAVIGERVSARRRTRALGLILLSVAMFAFVDAATPAEAAPTFSAEVIW